MIDTERREAARQFINRWRGKGKEDEDGRSYWIELLSNIFGVENVTERIDFEKKVVVDGHTKRIDVYIPETKVIIEQKSLNVPLDKKVRNSGEVDLTAFEQADRYNSKLIFDERARWIVTCNFAEIWIYDMNERQPKPSKIMLEELQTKYSLLDFLIKKEVQKISHEMEVSIKAGEIVGLIYNAFLEQYKIPKVKKNETEVEKEKREHKLKSLNALCVRLVFCLYNNFPWPTSTDQQKEKIEQTARKILDARELYPDSSLADLYDPLTMPPELLKAHTENNKVVMAAYGFTTKMSEEDCVAELMKLYQKLIKAEKRR